MEKLTSGKLGNAFSSFDITLKGTFEFPRKPTKLFEYSYDFPLGGFIIVTFGKFYKGKHMCNEMSYSLVK